MKIPISAFLPRRDIPQHFVLASSTFTSSKPASSSHFLTLVSSNPSHRSDISSRNQRSLCFSKSAKASLPPGLRIRDISEIARFGFGQGISQQRLPERRAGSRRRICPTHRQVHDSRAIRRSCRTRRSLHRRPALLGARAHTHTMTPPLVLVRGRIP